MSRWWKGSWCTFTETHIVLEQYMSQNISLGHHCDFFLNTIKQQKSGAMTKKNEVS